MERQRINHRKTLEDIVKRYKKNIVAINGIGKRCNEYVTNIKYLSLNLFICIILYVSRPKILYCIIIVLSNKYVLRHVLNVFTLYFDSIRYEKKQIALCRTWEYEQNKIQVTLENVIDDLEFLKDINMKLEQAIYKRKYVRIKFVN